jgi:phosphate:Na+ symporter
VLSLPVAASVLIGANVGTTSTALIASLGHRAPARRLALAHLVVKALGAVWVILFFHTHLQLMDSVLGNADPSLKIAAFHTWFNAMNALTWWLLLPLLVRVMRKLVPETVDKRAIFSSELIGLLSTMPERAIAECGKELSTAIQSLSWISDAFFHHLLGRGSGESRRNLPESASKKVHQLRESLEDIGRLLGRISAVFSAGPSHRCRRAIR